MEHSDFTPTPVNKLPYYSKSLGVNLFCKRDDLFLDCYGGSKARMLQYILKGVDSSNCDILVTAGGPNSNFNRSCALLCAKMGIKFHLVEYTDNPGEFESSLNYYLCNLTGMTKTRCSKTKVKETIEEVLADFHRRKIRAKFIYGGGKSLAGVYSYYDAIKELKAQQIDIDHLFVACGTGTTLTGICVGMQKYFPRAIVHGISIARSREIEVPILNENLELINDYLKEKYTFENLVFTDDYLCGGYAKSNQELLETVNECLQNTGMIIDTTYSGKAFWGMKMIIENSEDYKGKNVLFWNTGGIFNLLSMKQ